VTLGITDGTQTEVVSGVNEGDMVIVDGQAGLPDEARVTLVKNGETATEGNADDDAKDGEKKEEAKQPQAEKSESGNRR
jgi:hypothetical protein